MPLPLQNVSGYVGDARAVHAKSKNMTLLRVFAPCLHSFWNVLGSGTGRGTACKLCFFVFASALKLLADNHRRDLERSEGGTK